MDFSLPTQRCFYEKLIAEKEKALFSAYAEVFPAEDDFSTQTYTFSLPTQRCFRYETQDDDLLGLFSAYAEVFLTDNQASGLLKTFLCLRRGVSKRKKWKKPPRNFSLPTQRCFSRIRFPHQSSNLFSAYAEVFPGRVWSMTGDVGFSLPTQRCFSAY